MPSDPGPATVAEVLHATAEGVYQHCFAQAPTLGGGRLVCIDGPAGSGKTTLAETVVIAARRHLPSVALVHMDDLYEGWDGLPSLPALVRDALIEPLTAGRPGRFRRWDWLLAARAEEHIVDPVSLLVLEGVGSGGLEYDDAITTLVWVEAPADARLARGIERDGEALRPQWERWMVSEADHFLRQRTRERADVVVDGWA